MTVSFGRIRSDSPASWRKRCGKDPGAVARLTAQGNLSKGAPLLHHHFPVFMSTEFENVFGPPHWLANSKQCHGGVLAQ